MQITQVMGGMCPFFRISETTGRIALKFGLWLEKFNEWLMSGFRRKLNEWLMKLGL